MKRQIIVLFDLHVFPVACIIGKIYLHCIVLLQFSFLLILQREPLRTIWRPLCTKGATLRKEVQKCLTIIAISSPSTSTLSFVPPPCFCQNEIRALFFGASFVFIPTAAEIQWKSSMKQQGRTSRYWFLPSFLRQ